MKRLILLALLFASATSAWSVPKTTKISELETLLATLRDAKRNDSQVAAALKEVSLGEQLTRDSINRLAPYLPGPESVAQAFILYGRSALLPPPPSAIALPPLPDAAAQQSMLARAAELAKLVSQYPALNATRKLARFQDGPVVTNLADTGGFGRMSDSSPRSFEIGDPYMHVVGNVSSQVQNIAGLEQVPPSKTRINWGPNGMLSEPAPTATPLEILQRATAAGTLKFQQWEVVDERPLAVFSFSLDRKRFPLDINFCCFPSTQNVGSANNMMDGINLQSSTSWKPFKKTVGISGQLFIDPESGAITRLITHADLKPADFISEQDTRTDYDSIRIGDRTFLLPVHSIFLVGDTPYGESTARRVYHRRSLFLADYSDYAPAAQP